MSYLDDLKKKGQQFVQNVQKAADTANNVYNAAKQGVQNVYNAATGNTQKPATPQAQAPNTQPSPAAQPQNAQPAQAQPEVDWAAEYDKAMTPQATPTTGSQPGGQAAQPPTSAAAQSALGEGAGQWQAELDNVMAQIMGKGKFEYDMNGDAMYQQYADIYQNQANLGMQNAMAQAAALTGGYGSSYAQQVGQQAYAQQMQGLNEIGLDLYDRAYAQDQAEKSQLMDQYNMLAAREEQAYNRGIDERNFEYQKGRDETADSQWQQSFDYNKYLDELEQANFDKQFEYQQGRDTVADEQWNKQFASSEEQRAEDNAYRDEAFEYTKEQDKIAQEQWKAELDRMLANDEISQQQWQAEMDRALENDKTAKEQWEKQHNWQVEEWDKMYGENGYMTNKDKQDQENWQKEFDREGTWYSDAQEAANPNTTYEGEGALNGQSVPKQLAGVTNLTTTNTDLFDETGSLKNVAIVKTTPTGDGTDSSNDVVTYNIGGKEVELRRGYSPYTNNKNPDANNGTFNGYQPNNVASYYNGNKEAGKLSKAGFNTIVNGQEVPVFTTPDGKEWVYDAANNKYSEYEYEEKKEPTKITLPTGGKGNVEMKPTGFR